MDRSELRARLGDVMLRDRRRIERRLDDRRRPPDLTRLAAEVVQAEERIARRRLSVPELRYPEHLPVSQVRDEIADAIRDHQVVVLAGETGSGKTTQLPKILLGLGRGVTGLIGHTQPRRIAARAVAERVAEELGTEVGDKVGYTVRFHDQVSDSSLVKVMTDGILLAELARDRTLSAYDTIVIDEAHERSLTIDFLLGYLKQLLPQRPDLKVVITSATIDPERFSRHFDDAPVLEVSGRTYPVEVRYRPLEDDDQITAIVAACEELAAAGDGDVLVFLSGEREIRDTADALRAVVDRRTEVVPLYGRLSAAEQHLVFAPHTGRRIVLATNVAETSLTVPGIRYVVDPGTARISRYSNRTKVQRLPIEAISQASAQQRAGRCGRVADGICIRLYAEEDFLSRPEFTEPEILRTNLASVLLQMSSLGLGDIEDFPFVEPPDRRNVRDGIQLLEELGALDGDRLTKTGRQLAQLPVDPRMARMVVEAERLGCVREVLVIAAALSIQDPRERPLDKQQQAAEMHARFTDPTSDLLAWLNLWRHVQEQQKALSSSAFRRMCKREFLNYLRIREWQDLHGQLTRVGRQLDLAHDSSSTDPATVTQALLAGLLSHVGLKQDQREYLGARGARFTIAPGSALFKKPPQLVVAAELVETNRLWARGLARVEPEWVEQVGGHLLKRTYSEPHWEKKRGSVVAYERVTLYGVPIVAQRKVQYGSIDPVVSRDLFLRHALVQGDWETHHAFWKHNTTLLADVEEVEQRARRRDIVVDDDVLYDFYDTRVPADVVSGAHFDAWWKTQRHATPQLLHLSLTDLLRGDVDPGEHPDVWVSEDLRFDLSYEFEPGSAADGVTVDVPLAVLNRVRPEDFAWHVPGLRHELVTALIKSLPKALRVKLVPAPDTAAQLLERVAPREEHLLQALSREARHLRGVVIPVEEWGLDRVPSHLRPTFRVVDDAGKAVAEGKDLPALQQQLAQPVQAAISSVAGALEVSGLTSWTVEDIPAEVSSGSVVGYPALVDEGTTVALKVLPQPSPSVHHAGVRRLLLLGCSSPVKAVSGRLTNKAKLALAANPHGSLTALMDDCLLAAVDALVAEAPRDKAAFDGLLLHVRGELQDALLKVLQGVEQVLGLAAEVDAALATVTHPSAAAAVQDVRAQREALVHQGFVTEVTAARLPDLVRYLRGALLRLEKLPREADRDRALMRDVQEVSAEWARLPASAGKERVRWMLEELRVSLFAQTLKAKGPVSVQRVYRALDDVLSSPSSRARS
jgi:ATP-dependent helicase HrpA